MLDSRRAALPLAALCVGASAHAETLSGRVVGADGKPVAGAVVAFQAFTGADSPAVTTDADGRFALEAKGIEFTPGRVAGRIIAGAKGHAPLAVLYTPGKPVPPLRLEVARGSLRGSVVDRAGKPVGGVAVRVRLLIAGPPDAFTALTPIPESLNPLYSATSAADGGWVIANLPGDGRAMVEVADPRFVRASEQATLTAGEASGPALAARPAAVVAGRAVGPDGKPLAGVRVSAQAQGAGNGWAEAVTDASGAYRLTGLPSGSFNLFADPPPGAKDLVAAAAEGFAATEGKEAAAPDLKFTPGALVEGTVVDARTGAPLPNVNVGSYGPHRPRSSAAIVSVNADAQGRFRMRVAPGTSYIYVSGVAEGYLRGDGSATTLTLKEGERATPTLKLAKGETLRGVVVDEAGNPQDGVTVTVGASYEGRTAPTSSGGGFLVAGLPPGEVAVTIAGEEWEVVGGRVNVAVPAAEPVRVTVRRAPPTRRLTGRVVDAAGNPVAGMNVIVRRSRPGGQPGLTTVRTENLASDATGVFALAGIRADETITLSARKAGYRYVRGGAVTGAGGTDLAAADLVVTPLSGVLTGTVVDPKGKPVPGILVTSPDRGPSTPAVTDAKGSFRLEGLPGGEVTVFAAGTAAWADGRFRAGGAGATLTLARLPADAPDLARAYRILEAVWSDPKGGNFAKQAVPAAIGVYDPDLAVKMAAGPDGRVDETLVQGILAQLSERDPALAVKWGMPRLRSLQDEYMRRVCTLHVARSLVWLGRTGEAQALYAALKRDIGPDAPGGAVNTATAPPDLFNRLFLTSLAAALRSPEAVRYAREALQIGRKLGGGELKEQGIGEAVLVSLARGGDIAAVRVVLPDLPEAWRPVALAEAARVSAERFPLAARDLLTDLERLNRERGGADGNAERKQEEAAKSIAQRLARTDPVAAAAVARGVGRPLARGLALALAAGGQTDPAKRDAQFREAFDAVARSGDYERVETASRVASLAWNADARLGRELFAKAKELLAREEAGGEDFRSERSRAALAFYFARVSRGESRLLLEEGFARALGASAAGTQERQTAPSLALAMAAVDPDRAVAMANALPAGVGDGLNVRRKVGQYVAAPMPARRAFPFDPGNAPDAWMP